MTRHKFETFVSRRWRPGETVGEYLGDALGPTGPSASDQRKHL